MKKLMKMMMCLVLPAFALSAKGTNPHSGASGRGGTNPASTDYVGSSKYSIGQFAQGGVVIWVTEDGQHGLVAAIDDQGVFAWSNVSQETFATYNDPLPTSTPNAPYGQYYPGYSNQQTIETGFTLSNYPAFHACVNYSKTVGGVTYDDWFLPSSRELSLMYAAVGLINEVSVAHGGFEMDTNTRYWSSREDTGGIAWVLYFLVGFQNLAFKDVEYAVRCVRAF